VSLPTCEWSREKGRPAGISEHLVPATLLVGSSRNQWLLCAECAALPRFKAFKKRPFEQASSK
jgi:hypothetical protein